MDTNQIAIRRWEDVVFEHRNKSYGAYLLRRAYASRLLLGLLVTSVLTGLLLSLQRIHGKQDVTVKTPAAVKDDVFTFMLPPPIEKRPPAQRPPSSSSGKVANRAVVVTTEEVVEQEAVTELAEFISDEEGISGELTGTTEGTGSFALPEPVVHIEPAVLDIAQVMPEYAGGIDAMMKFIQKKIRYPRVPKQLGISGTVYVRFIVNGDGSVSDVEVIRGVHRDYDNEAIRVISMLSGWTGGSHNGRPVAVRMVLPIKFHLQQN